MKCANCGAVAGTIAGGRLVCVGPDGWCLACNVRASTAGRQLLAACEALLQNATLFNRETDAVWRATRDLAVSALAAARGHQ